MKLTIDKENIPQYINDAVENTFAEFVFMDAAPIDAADCQMTIPLASQILIHHPFCGEVELTADEELVKKMAENLMMISPEDLTAEQINDVLYEMVNTLAGRILAKLLPEEQTFKLGLPETTQSFMEADDQFCQEFYFKIDDQYCCKITLLAEI